jgi:hypothetical protein
MSSIKINLKFYLVLLRGVVNCVRVAGWSLEVSHVMLRLVYLY